MNATQAYNSDDTFRMLLDMWVNEKQCPVPLLDRAQELNCEEGVSACVRWCLRIGLRPQYISDELMGVYPNSNGPISPSSFYWFDIRYREAFKYCTFANCVPEGAIMSDLHPSQLQAILHLLDHWKPEIGLDWPTEGAIL